MRFRLDITKAYFLDGNDTLEKLKALGFKIAYQDNGITGLQNYSWECCEEAQPEIEFNTLEELIEFSEKWGRLVFDAQEETIEIYNDWRE